MVLQQQVEGRIRRAAHETEQVRHSMKFWAASLAVLAIAGLLVAYYSPESLRVMLTVLVPPGALVSFLLATFAFKIATVRPRRLKDTLSDLAEQGRALGTAVVQHDSAMPKTAMDAWADCCRDTLETYLGAHTVESWEASVDRGRPSQRFSGLAEERRVRTRNRLVAGSEWLEALIRSGSPPASQSETDNNAE